MTSQSSDSCQPLPEPFDGRQPTAGASDARSALAIRGLGKRFGDKIAVNGVSLDVPMGSFYGLVGPNGAGKTTMLSMATGLLRPEIGRAHV